MMPGTLSLYIARRFTATALWAFAAVFMLVVVVDMVELMRANDRGLAGFGDLLGMALLHAPSVTITAAPFTMLLASMAAFAMLARSSELVVTRAAGVSAWRLIAPAVVSAGLLGIAAFAVYNPLASAFALRFEVLEQRFLDESASRLALSDRGLWLRQGGDGGQTVIRARRASSTVERLWDVSIFQFDGSDRLRRRIDARTAVLGEQSWTLGGVQRWELSDASGTDRLAALGETRAVALDEMRIPTDLTVEHIQDSFAAPETIGFWKLPGFIALLEQSGFSSSRHRMHWYRLLSAPVVFVAMVLVGAAFSMRHIRFGGLGFMALGCVMAGFGYFFVSDIANALGASGTVPVAIAAWAPPLSAMLFALGLLLHLEDG
jgi:lipopolysaccharide export system permease protein